MITKNVTVTKEVSVDVSVQLTEYEALGAIQMWANGETNKDINKEYETALYSLIDSIRNIRKFL